MDILIDTNILISAFVFPDKSINKFFLDLCKKYNVLICSYSLIELADVLGRKFPHLVGNVDEFLMRIKFTQIFTPAQNVIDEILGEISLRDKKDNPILASAIFADADVLITGDKDFFGLNIERPQILTVNEFLDLYI
ncbi:MAG: putative toxin-antitoxin system toxin component, PIN family [Ruminococcus sp.]|jgi:putative PIN family toxin of toxin-antitoxin system|nr:putative toxin-antitoxin system toxin component, PIN family [Ruminococcus sp.]